MSPSWGWLEKMADIEDECESVGVGGMAADLGCYFAPDPRTRFQKIRDRLFPEKYCSAPDAPSEFKDCILGQAVTKLSWADRLRVLITGVVVTNWRTVTENEVGRTVTNAVCFVSTSKYLKEK
jgi:hypothetical protein